MIKEKLEMCIFSTIFLQRAPNLKPPKEYWSMQKEYYFFTGPQSLNTIFSSDIKEATQGSSLIYLTVNKNQID